MSFMDSDKKSILNHVCKICKKGFGCGRALGGHMRAHGIGDESSAMDDDDDDAASDWEDRKLDEDNNDNIDPSNKRMYALRANPNRLKSCMTCENCGKEFKRWRSLLEHRKCCSDDAGDEFFFLSPGSDGDDMSGGRGCSWSKKKRSFRTKVGISFNNNDPNCSSSNEDEDLANCLMMLSNDARDSSTLASIEEEGRNPSLGLMAPISSDHNNKAKEVENNNNNKSAFECKACKKVFNSHQALGGHRASHKKVKGCFAARLHSHDEASTDAADDDIITAEDPLFTTNHKSNDNNSTLDLDQGSNNNNAASFKRKSKVHECSICQRVFSSGQALGGHKRCHWITSTAPDTSTLARFQQFQDQIEQHMKNNNPVIPSHNKFSDSDDDPIHLKLDLNLPAPSTARNVSAETYLQSWVAGGGKVAKQHEDNNSQSHQNQYGHHELDNENSNDEEGKNNNRYLNISKDSMVQKVVEDKEDNNSKVKLAKLSEDDVGGSSLPWLQVGIGSTTTTDVGNGG